jgi:hypothetical protein
MENFNALDFFWEALLIKQVIHQGLIYGLILHGSFRRFLVKAYTSCSLSLCLYAL